MRMWKGGDLGTPPVLTSGGYWSTYVRSATGRYASYWYAFLLPPANEERVMLPQVCVSSGGGVSTTTHPEGVSTRPPPDTWDTTGYGQQAGGMHPTGMRSCILQCVQLTLTSPSEAEEFLEC